MINDPGDNLEWARHLGCPPSVCTDQIKKILNHGILSHVWDVISPAIHSAEDVTEARKNILLHYLKNQEQLTSIVQIHNTKRLKQERTNLELQYDKLQEEHENVHKSLERKGSKLAKLKDEQSSTRIKKNILEVKLQETAKEMESMQEMLSTCHKFQPAYKCDIDPNVINQIFTMIASMSCRQDEREAFKKISETLGTTAVSELWRYLLNKRIEETEKFVNLGSQHEHSEGTDNNKIIDIGIARMCGQRIISTATKLIHLRKAEEEKERVLNYIEILSSVSNDAATDWLALTLEVAKLENKQRIIVSQIQEFKSKLIQEEDDIQYRQMQVSCDIREVRSQKQEVMRLNKHHLMELDTAPQFLREVNNQLTIISERILSLRAQNTNEWQGDCSQTELQVFYENFDINALDKLMLRGRIGAHRYVSTCISNALISNSSITSASPVYRAPLYHLIYCYRDLVLNTLIKQRKKDSETLEPINLNLQGPVSTRRDEIIQLLDSVNSVSQSCRQEIERFHSVNDAWLHQPVQKIMEIINTSVHGATYPEWVQQFTALAYMIQRQK